MRRCADIRIWNHPGYIVRFPTVDQGTVQVLATMIIRRKKIVATWSDDGGDSSPFADAANDEKILRTHWLCCRMYINRQRPSRFPTLVPSLVSMLVSDDDGDDGGGGGGGGDCVIVVVRNDFKPR